MFRLHQANGAAIRIGGDVQPLCYRTQQIGIGEALDGDAKSCICNDTPE